MKVDVKNLAEKKLEALIEEATVDAYGDEEQLVGVTDCNRKRSGLQSAHFPARINCD
jgi:hypothetical protein